MQKAVSGGHHQAGRDQSTSAERSLSAGKVVGHDLHHSRVTTGTDHLATDHRASSCRHDQREQKDRARRHQHAILKAWSSDEPFSHEGRFWHYQEIVVEPCTAQKPHPPVWIGAGTPESVCKVAALGATLLLDQFSSTEAIASGQIHAL